MGVLRRGGRPPHVQLGAGPGRAGRRRAGRAPAHRPPDPRRAATTTGVGATAQETPMTDDAAAATPLATPLLDRHVALGARMVDYAGWLMPVQYAGIVEEHRAVRERAGLFDLSHMGELFVEGPEAGASLARALITDPPSLEGRPGALLDDLRPGRRDHRRPHRLPARRGALPRRRQRRRTRPPSPTRSPSASTGCASSSTTGRATPRSSPIQGPASRGDPRAARPRRSRRAPLLRDRGGIGRRRPGPHRPDRVHRRGRIRAVRRVGARGRGLGRGLRGRRGRRRSCRSGSVRATRSGSRPGCRCTATSWTARPIRSRPGSAAS